MTQALVEFEPQAAPKDPLAAAADLLEDAIRGEVAGRKRDWAAGVVRALRHVERGLRRYHDGAQTADGSFADLDRMRPTLFWHWKILCLHYGTLVDVQRSKYRLDARSRAWRLARP